MENLRDSSLKVKNKDMGRWIILMGPNIKAIIIMIKGTQHNKKIRKRKEHKLTPINLAIEANGWMIWSMAKVKRRTKTILLGKANGKMTIDKNGLVK